MRPAYDLAADSATEVAFRELVLLDWFGALDLWLITGAKRWKNGAWMGYVLTHYIQRRETGASGS